MKVTSIIIMNIRTHKLNSPEISVRKPAYSLARRRKNKEAKECMI